jgi:hypothetical protein
MPTFSGYIPNPYSPEETVTCEVPFRCPCCGKELKVRESSGRDVWKCECGMQWDEGVL